MNTPHKCPACAGAGLVSRPPHVPGDQTTWESVGTNSHPCRSCAASGVVWSAEHQPVITLPATFHPGWVHAPAEQTTRSHVEMVREFHEVFGAPVAGHLQVLGVDHPMAKLRIEMIREEFEELVTAITGSPVKVLIEDAEDGVEWSDQHFETDIVEVADALADLAYFIYGTALVYGIDFDAVFAEVHRSNMAKVGPDGKVVRREDGKVMKPEGWTPPDVACVLGLGGD